MKNLKVMMGASLLALGLSAQASDFNGHVIGVRGGGTMNFGRNETKASPPGVAVRPTDKFSIGTPQGFAGVDYTWQTGMWSPDLDWGLVFTADWMFGDANTKLETPTSNTNYSIKQKDRYTLGARFGVCTSDKVYPFLKAGFVAGQFDTNVRSVTGRVSSTDWMYGATVGMGVDFSIHAGGTVGFVTELDWYASKEHKITPSGAASFTKLDVKPWTANVGITYKYKIMD